jgi:hypothetical protein
MRHAVLILAISGLFLANSGPAKADLIALHQGTTDPTTPAEGFAPFGIVSAGPLANDLGLPAWSVNSVSLNNQAFNCLIGPRFPQSPRAPSQRRASSLIFISNSRRPPRIAALPFHRV